MAFFLNHIKTVQRVFQCASSGGHDEHLATSSAILAMREVMISYPTLNFARARRGSGIFFDLENGLAKQVPLIKLANCSCNPRRATNSYGFLDGEHVAAVHPGRPSVDINVKARVAASGRLAHGRDDLLSVPRSSSADAFAVDELHGAFAFRAHGHVAHNIGERRPRRRRCSR